MHMRTHAPPAPAGRTSANLMAVMSSTSVATLSGSRKGEGHSGSTSSEARREPSTDELIHECMLVRRPAA